MSSFKGLIIAGPSSGVGKTTVSLALMAAARRRGLDVQAFKVGPDFIDPGHHAVLTGRPAHNLDGWMLSPEENLAIFHRYAREADLVIVEGVMGLYDGRDGHSQAGSTAEMAKWLDLPVLLVVDARSMARSLAALVQGFINFDSEVKWAGILANRVGSPRHQEIVAQAMSLVPGVKYWGGLSRDEEIGLPERHLGLVTAEETLWSPQIIGRLVDWLEAGLQVPALMAALPERPTLDFGLSTIGSNRPEDRPVRIGVARDQAFCFYYQENLRRLAEAGAEIVFFSPLADGSLPKHLDGMYIGGGYPEVFAQTLAANQGMLRDIREFGNSGRPVYAECGGLMYLGRELSGADGQTWPMAGLLPLTTRLGQRLRSLGYRQVTFTEPTILGPAGLTARGHEFHYSDLVRADETWAVSQVTDGSGRTTSTVSYGSENLLASYVHLHFGSQPDLAGNFVKTCLKVRGTL